MAFLVMVVALGHGAFAAASPNPQALQHYRQGQAYLSGKNFTGAITEFRAAIQLDPTFAEPHARLSDIYDSFNDFDHALKEILQAKALDPGQVLYEFREGQIYLENKQPGRAIAPLQHVLQRQPDNPEFHFALASAFAKTGQAANARAYFLKAISLNPKKGGYYVALGDFEYGQQHLDAAGAAYQHAMALFPQGDPNVQNTQLKLDNIKNELNALTLQRYLWIFWAAVGVACVMWGGLLVWRKAGERRMVEALKRLDIPTDDLEGVARNVLHRIAIVTRMTTGMTYLVNRDGAVLSPGAALGVDKLKVDPIEIREKGIVDWLSRQDGRPFAFALEKREETFQKAFPDAVEILERHDIRMGVPLLFRRQLEGIVFLGHKKFKDLPSVRRAFEQQMDVIEHLAAETAEAIENFTLYEMSVMDELTKTYNRRYFTTTLFNEVQKVRQYGNPCSLLLVDLDLFKHLNDTFGHPQGDVVLRRIAGVIKGCLREGIDTLCRVGGEEFAVVMPSATETDAEDMAEIIRQTVANHQMPYPLPQVTISLGVATFPTHAPTAEELVDRADEALYASKGQGRNRVTVSTGAKSPPPPALIDEEAAPGSAPLGGDPFGPPSESEGSTTPAPAEDKVLPWGIPVGSEPAGASWESGAQGDSPAIPVPWGAPQGGEYPEAATPWGEDAGESPSPNPPWNAPGVLEPPGTGPVPGGPAIPGRTGSWAGQTPTMIRPRLGRGLIHKPSGSSNAHEGASEPLAPPPSPLPPAGSSPGAVISPSSMGPAGPPLPRQDPETNYFAADYFSYRLGEEMKTAQAGQRPCALMVFSIDNLSRAGEPDAAGMSEIIARVNDFLKPDVDLPGRLGENMFGVILPRTTGLMAYNLADQIKTFLAQIPLGAGGANVRLSVGIAAYPDQAKTADELTAKCLAAFSTAQQGGGGQAILAR